MHIEPRNPADPFVLNGRPLGFSVGDFWRWGVSELLVNTTRGAVAEFLVGQALGCVGLVRRSWDPYDLQAENGVKIEVKSASYTQAWQTTKQSRISFNIGPSRPWDSEKNKILPDPKRHADIYVFSLLNNQCPTPNDPLDASRWEFFVLPTSTLEKFCPNQKTIGLGSLKGLNPIRADYVELPLALKQALNSRPAASASAPAGHKAQVAPQN
jgi:hypothetical protein